MNSELNKRLKALAADYPCSYSIMLSKGKQYADLLVYVMESTAGMPEDIPLPARVFYTLTDAEEPAKCKVCGEDIPHSRKCNALTGYASLCCSRRCAQLDPDHIARLEKASMEKYGVRRPQMAETVKEKMRTTLAEKLDSFWDAAAEKRRRTCLERYGAVSVSQTEDVRRRKSEKMLAKTGEELAERHRKAKKTCFERHGKEMFVNQVKANETRVANAAADPEYWNRISRKRKSTMMSRYGVDCAAKLEESKKKVRRSHIVKSFEEYISKSEYVEPLFDVDHYCEHRSEDLPWRCRECGREFSAPVGDQMYFPARCLACHPLHSPSSRPEQELAAFIKSIYDGEVVENDRTVIKPNELDVYLPKLGLAFEMDGLLWHSEEMGTPPGYHLAKTEKCEAACIRLVHVTEAEWRCRREITESRVKSLLGRYDRRIYARDCEVREVAASESKAFQEKNHIQGYAPAKVSIGLFHGGELVALMTFGKCRFDKKHEWELVRFCCGLGVQVVGGAGRLLKHFERQYSPSSIVSYADRRWSQGGLYRALGFRLDHASRPDYRYWNRKKGVYMPESRVKYQKHRLKNILKDFDPASTESENMKSAGFVRIYDCGNLVFVKERELSADRHTPGLDML